MQCLHGQHLSTKLTSCSGAPRGVNGISATRWVWRTATGTWRSSDSHLPEFAVNRQKAAGSLWHNMEDSLMSSGEPGFAPETAKRPRAHMDDRVMLAVDAGLAVIGGMCFTYGTFCTSITGGDNIDGVCPDPLYAILLAFGGGCLLLRPTWLVLHRLFPKKCCRAGVLYYACREWTRCGGCGGLFPVVCVFNLFMLLAAASMENAIVIGVTDGVPAEPISTTFWSLQEDAWNNDQVCPPFCVRLHPAPAWGVASSFLPGIDASEPRRPETVEMEYQWRALNVPPSAVLYPVPGPDVQHRDPVHFAGADGGQLVFALPARHDGHHRA